MSHPFFFAYDVEEYNLGPHELQILAELVVGGPVFLRYSDKKIVASVSHVAIEKPGTLLLRLAFSDETLEKNIQDTSFVHQHFLQLDPVECVLNEGH